VTLNYYKANLTNLEHHELQTGAHPEIYFLGSRSIHKIGSKNRPTGASLAEGNLSFSKTDDGVFNSGYDDSRYLFFKLNLILRGDYYLITHDHIAYRYEIIGALGKGSFGQVAKCYDHKEKKYIALKIIRNKKRCVAYLTLISVDSRSRERLKCRSWTRLELRITIRHTTPYTC
jgi:hypothetical protein